MSSELFLPEAVRYRTSRKRNRVILDCESSFPVINWTLCILLVALILLMFFLDYKETDSARGRLVPRGAEQQLVAPQAALVRELKFSLGDKVKAGDVVATLSRDLFGADGVSLSVQAQEFTRSKLVNLQKEKRLAVDAHDLRTNSVRAEIEQSKKQLAFYLEEGEILTEQLKISSDLLSKMNLLRLQASVPEADYRQREFEHLNLIRTVQANKQQVESARAEVAHLQNRFSTTEAEYQIGLSKLYSLESELTQQLKLDQQKEELSILALRDGVISTIAVVEGEAVSAGQPLIYLQPDHRSLLAEIYVSSSVVAKLAPGQEVMLRYDAFDFQSYGRYSATIDRISRSPLDPREHQIPSTNSIEPLFPVTATLEQHFVEGPDVFPLQSGLLLGADFITAEMSVIEFIFKPLLGLRGKVS